MKRRIHVLNILIIMTMLLGACNLPRGESTEDASNTAAAETVQAFLTTTARPVTPTVTLTRIPINPSTPTIAPATLQPPASATSICDAMQFVADVTIPDGTVMTPNQAFTKTWRVKNVGTCAW